jgi:ribonuclease BN (tRNA processing enzyme)
MLGTGTPRPDPNRSGPATAIVVNNTPYLIDFGPGVIRRATAAYENGVTALGFGGINTSITHLPPRCIAAVAASRQSERQIHPH